jgi:ABC-type uncharacterized transport system permease subunit
MSQLRIFWEIVRRAVQRQLTYRAATLAGLATNLFFGLLRAAVLLALRGKHGGLLIAPRGRHHPPPGHPGS